jgi:hypothetical protein
MSLDKRFDLAWGFAPQGTPKYQAGEKAKRILNSEIKRAKREVAERFKGLTRDEFNNVRPDGIELGDEIESLANQILEENKEEV